MESFDFEWRKIGFNFIVGSLHKFYDCVFIVDIENASKTIKFKSEIEWKLVAHSTFNMLNEEIFRIDGIIWSAFEIEELAML